MNATIMNNILSQDYYRICLEEKQCKSYLKKINPVKYKSINLSHSFFYTREKYLFDLKKKKELFLSIFDNTREKIKYTLLNSEKNGIRNYLMNHLNGDIFFYIVGFLDPTNNDIINYLGESVITDLHEQLNTREPPFFLSFSSTL